MGSITAVVTNYNKPPWALSRCIASIEKYDIPYILVDDASSNNPILEDYKNVIRLKDNVGPYKAFEAGLNEVSTEYVMRVDADDYIYGVPDISDGYEAYINNLDSRVYTTIPEFLDSPYAGLNGLVIKTEVCKKLWYTGLKYHADIVIFCRILRGCRFYVNPKSIYFYDKELSEIARGGTHSAYLIEAKAQVLKENK